MRTELPDGARVEYEHRRYAEGAPPFVYAQDYMRMNGKPYKHAPKVKMDRPLVTMQLLGAGERKNVTIDPKGGLTICTIKDADGKVIARGESHCHPHDNFVYQIGRGRAYGRALASLKKLVAA